MAENSENPKLSPKRSSETLTGEETSPRKRSKPLSSSPSSSSKGKEKIDESNSDSSGSQCCGICLSEDGRAIRGWIDSCDHYFCFVCIMEWAKVESRCPMCKQRFSTIRRPPRDGVFPSERLVNVPVRDQVYHYFGNATVVPPDPYAETQCTVCHSARDESLLLLCDLCDSASHTFCVGLGATVPEGDWFCQDCSVSRAEHVKSEEDASVDFKIKFQKMPRAEEHVSVFDIVQESNSQRPCTTLSSHPNELQYANVEPNGADLDARTLRQHAEPNGGDLDARTLRRCRNVRNHIQALRENWNDFRSGSLSFSNMVDCIGSNNSGRSHLPHSTTRSSQEPGAEKVSSGDVSHNRSSNEIEKAWKMMDAAKSMVQARTRTINPDLTSKYPPSRLNAQNKKTNMSSNNLMFSSRCHGAKEFGSMGPKEHTRRNFQDTIESQKSQTFEKQKQSTITMKKTLKSSKSFRSIHSGGCSEVPSPSEVQSSTRGGFHHGIVRKLSEVNFLEASREVPNEHDGSAGLICPVESVPIASKKSCVKVDALSSNKLKPHEGETKNDKCCDDSNTNKHNAKSEIQSLVKLNLKLLGGDKKLGFNGFKEVARLATHSILAKCGLEQPKHSVRSFPCSVCRHTNQSQQLRMSTLLPSSCRECFYVFVKDVVSTMMDEKLHPAKSLC